MITDMITDNAYMVGVNRYAASHQGVGCLVSDPHHDYSTYLMPTRSRSEVSSGPIYWLQTEKEVTQPPRLNLFPDRGFAF